MSIKIKDDKCLKELERFGFRKHKTDDESVLVSKWGRIWMEEDRSDGYDSYGSWTFAPMIKILENRYIRTYNHWDFEREINDMIFKLTELGYVEEVRDGETEN